MVLPVKESKANSSVVNVTEEEFEDLFGYSPRKEMGNEYDDPSAPLCLAEETTGDDFINIIIYISGITNGTRKLFLRGNH